MTVFSTSQHHRIGKKGSDGLHPTEQNQCFASWIRQRPALSSSFAPAAVHHSYHVSRTLYITTERKLSFVSVDRKRMRMIYPSENVRRKVRRGWWFCRVPHTQPFVFMYCVVGDQGSSPDMQFVCRRGDIPPHLCFFLQSLSSSTGPWTPRPRHH